jgi:hypothetical protein
LFACGRQDKLTETFETTLENFAKTFLHDSPWVMFESLSNPNPIVDVGAALVRQNLANPVLKGLTGVDVEDVYGMWECIQQILMVY